MWRGDAVAACGSLWWDGFEGVWTADRWDGDLGATASPRVGRLGGLEATDTEAAVAFLHQAGDVLRQQGCTLALGPMDGTTWQSYRCALTWDNGPPFFGEPQTDPRWVDWFLQAGFTPVAKYVSRLCLDLTQTHSAQRQRHTPASVQIQSAQGVAVEALLPNIYALVMASFRRQPLFQPLPEPLFIQHLRPLLSQVDPALIQLAWDHDHLVGIVLALPDLLATDSQRFIIKTLAIWPNRAYAGLGTTLLEAAHRAGYHQGYRQAIHALMHCQNPSLSLSRRYSQPFRDYVLMGKALA
ncbi:hypothetical protein GFS31_17640 [Leptolyngbya sp. BL0902]|nr:hypothetical protein GFS31_17640 [Leptolyngbya sp. BL0902]